MKVAICDDDQKVTEDVKMFFKELFPDMTPTIFHNPFDFIKDQKVYDVLFLDIDMPDMNGIEVGNLLRKKNTHTSIIYITNLSEYRPMAFGVHAFDYLEKPITKETLSKVMKDLFIYQKQQIQTTIPVLGFKSREGILRLPISEILYFEFINRKVCMHTIQDIHYLMTSLHAIKETMAPFQFESPHKSFCVNLNHVRLVKGYDIFMSNNDVIPLSQKQSSKFRAVLNQHLNTCLHGGAFL